MANYKPKACAQCGIEFTPTHPSNTYCTPSCRDDARLQRARKNNLRYRQKNRDRINKQKRKRYQANREAINAKKRTQYALDPTRPIERARKYREENKEAISERKRKYRNANIEHIRAKDRKYYENNRARRIEQVYEWQVRNPEKVDAIKARRAKVMLEGNAKPQLIEAKWEASDKTCILCGQPIDDTLPPRHRMALTIEHLTPIARGGRHDLDNIDFAHWGCNARKGAKTLHEYQEWAKQAT